MRILIRKGTPSRIRTKDHLNNQCVLFNELYENLLKVFSEINTAFIFIDAATNELLYVNEVFCRMVGFKTEEIFRKSLLVDLIPKKNLENFISTLKNVSLHLNHTYSFTSVLERKDNKKITVEITARGFVMNGQSQIVMIIKNVTKIISDNLMKNLMEEALQESERRYRSIIENVKDYAIFLIDNNGMIISWNLGAEKTLGYKEEEIILKKFNLLFKSDDDIAGNASDLLEKARQTGYAQKEIRLFKKDRSNLWASLTITSLNGNESNPETYSVIIRDLTKYKVSEELLHEQEIQLRSLAKHLQDAREEEKLRIARELHDEFSQMLTVLRMDLSLLSNTISKNVVEPYKRISLLEKISSISELLEKTIRSTRRIISELRPAVLDELGLYTAIQWQAQEFENRTGIRSKIIKLQHDLKLDNDTSTAIFRILQEGLTNIAKHSGASSAVISLKVKKDNLILEITDNGTGIDENKQRAPTSTGLIGIRERVMALNGNFEIHSNKDEGTQLRVAIPYNPEN
jgi:two-component system sensor histidine kinase UhpB